MDTYLTAFEVAELLKLSVQSIRRYTMNREIPFHKINRSVRYKKTEIEQWVENGRFAQPMDLQDFVERDLFNDALSLDELAEIEYANEEADLEYD
jgi:excisionase family DNA binding protein